MEPTVLAGPIEFSPAEIAGIVAVLAAFFVIVTSPGWVLVAVAAHRRRTARGPGSAWGAAVGGGLGGLLLCCGVAALVGALLQDLGGAAVFVAVLAAWVACWGLARWLSPRRADRPAPGNPPPYPVRPSERVDSTGSDEGWGR